MQNLRFSLWNSKQNPAFFVFVGGTLCLLFAVSNRVATGDTGKSVELIIDFSDGSEKRFKQIPWRKNMNILHAMNHAKQHPRGISFDQRGKGATAFIRKIEDLENQGGAGKNWIYRVNKKLGDKSFAIYPLKPGDTILWKFDTYP